MQGEERQGMIEGRIMELKDKLGRAEVIDCTKINCDRVVFGAVVTLADLENFVSVYQKDAKYVSWKSGICASSV